MYLEFEHHCIPSATGPMGYYALGRYIAHKIVEEIHA